MKDLIKYRHDLEVVRNTADQIIKDFGLFGIIIHFSGNEKTAYQELKSQLIPELTKLYDQSFSKLQAILYRIDVPENKFVNLPGNGKEERISALAELIMERELIKVILRKIYKP